MLQKTYTEKPVNLKFCHTIYEKVGANRKQRKKSREICTTKTKNIVLAFLKNRNIKSYNIKFLYELSK